jgi:hypothetical protein
MRETVARRRGSRIVVAMTVRYARDRRDPETIESAGDQLKTGVGWEAPPLPT